MVTILHFPEFEQQFSVIGFVYTVSSVPFKCLFPRKRLTILNSAPAIRTTFGHRKNWRPMYVLT